MKKIFLFFLPILTLAQADYELEFNSVMQDYVEIPNASAVIANKTSFSISGWVNPQADSSHSGFFGFRNNTDADFYLLQLTGSNNIEARFRNSSGSYHDIVSVNALSFNQWQHLAFTYDGSYIRLYKDGALLDSTAASGTITQVNESLKLGALDYQGTSFHMIGRLDEIRLWDVALSQVDINNWMCSELNINHPNYNNLMGYWNLNEGSGLTTYDQSVNGNNGVLSFTTTWQTSTSCLASIECGDVNENGVVDQSDVTDINSFILGSPPLVFNSWAADVNCDGTINISDITILNNSILGTGSLNCCSTSPLPLTYVPDHNFEAYLEANGMGNGVPNDDYVTTANIDTVTSLNVGGQNISDLTGIEDFTALTYLHCWSNQLTSLDVSQNTALTYLECDNNPLGNLNVSNNTDLNWLQCGNNQLTTLNVSQNTFLIGLDCAGNQLTSLDVSTNAALTTLKCEYNQLTSLDVSQNTALTTLYCSSNQLVSLDVSQNISLTQLRCKNNQLTSLDLRNGNNTNFTDTLLSYNNPNLFCINVDNVSWSNVNWPTPYIDPQHYFSNNCSGTTAIQEYTIRKELLRITDLLGRKTKEKKNQSLFYIYDDGTVEKKIIVE